MAAVSHSLFLLGRILYAYVEYIYTAPRTQPIGNQRQRTSPQMSQLSVPTVHTDM